MDFCKSLLKEIIPQFGLPKSLQSNNGPSFIARITQGLTTALGIDYKLHTSWHPQVFREGRESEPPFKENLSKALPRDS